MGAPPPALSPAPLTFREPRWLPVRRCMCGLTPNTQNTSVSMKKMHFDRKHEHQPQPSLVHCDSHRQWRAERGLRAPIRLAGRRGTHEQRPARAQHPHLGRTREMLVNCTLIKGAAAQCPKEDGPPRPGTSRGELPVNEPHHQPVHFTFFARSPSASSNSSNDACI